MISPIVSYLMSRSFKGVFCDAGMNLFTDFFIVLKV